MKSSFSAPDTSLALANIYLAVFWPYILILLLNLLVGVLLFAKLMGVLKAT